MIDKDLEQKAREIADKAKPQVTRFGASPLFGRKSIYKAALEALQLKQKEVDEKNAYIQEMVRLAGERHRPAYDEQQRRIASLQERCERLESENAKFKKWIRNHNGVDLQDHACKQCAPYSDIIIEGFVCAKHLALTLPEEATTKADSAGGSDDH